MTIKIWRVLSQNKSITNHKDFAADDFGKLIDKLNAIAEDLTKVTQVLLLSEVQE